MNDMNLTNMTAFLERHDRRSRRVYIGMVAISLAVSAVIFTHGVLTTGSPNAVLADLWVPIVIYPFFLIAFYSAIAIWGRTRPKPPGGRYLMNADDARNIARVANAGFMFVFWLRVINIFSQAGIALADIGVLKSMNMSGDWVGRAILVAMGVLSIYFGNSWARMPTPRAPDQKPATQLKYLRLSAWLTVTIGLLLALAALLPNPIMPPAVGVLSVSAILAWVAYFVRFRSAMKSPSAS